MVVECIGLGLLLSLLFSQLIGFTAGGMVVPGYIAIYLHEPLRVLGTIIVALTTFFIVKLLSNFIFIYGHRRIMITVIIGFLLGNFSQEFLEIKMFQISVEIQSIGHIIPGLIANWMERQGIIPTLCIMLTTAAIVRLLLIILTGGKAVI
jgi:poly-gamma-glutamate biosynthesis protein PgsC/CapC